MCKLNFDEIDGAKDQYWAQIDEVFGVRRFGNLLRISGFDRRESPPWPFVPEICGTQHDYQSAAL